MSAFFQNSRKIAHMGVVCARLIAFFRKIFAYLNKNSFLCTRNLKPTPFDGSLKRVKKHHIFSVPQEGNDILRYL